MRRLTLLFFYGYVAMLLGVGGAGLLVAPWELQTIFHVDLAGMTAEARNTLLNQYRFLKSLELGFGLFSVLFRHNILRRSVFNRLFLTVLFLGVAARGLSLLLDGAAHAAFLAFMILELITGVLVIYLVYLAPPSP